MIGEIFGPVLGIATGNAAAAMTREQLIEWQVSNARLTMQAAPSANLYEMFAQYRPAVHVPQGYADWYAMADEMVG